MYTSCATSRGTSRFAHHIHEGIPTSRDFEPADIVYILAALRSQLLRLVMSFCLSIFGILQLKMHNGSLTHPGDKISKLLFTTGREGAAVFHPCAYITTHKILQFFKLGPVQASINITFCASNKKTDRQCENCFYLIRNCVLFQWAIFCLFFVISVILYY